MFTFLHAADIHLDSPLRGLSAHPEAPVQEIRSASRRALENLVSLAIEEDVDFILIAGDLYDGNWPDFSTGHFFNQQMRLLRDASIPVYLISGNHDAESKLTKSLDPPENVTVFPTNKPASYQLKELNVTIHGQGFASAVIQENLALNFPSPTTNHFNIGLLHCSVGASPDHGTYAPCSLTDLKNKQYNYWALGHIHQASLLSENPHIAYSGNIQGRHVRETGPRGCYLISVDDDLTISDQIFHELDVIRWENLHVDLTDLDDEDSALQAIRAALSQEVKNTSPRLLCARLTLTGDTLLHSDFHLHTKSWLARIIDLAQDVSSEGLWIEKLLIKTKARVNLEQLASQSDLTEQVLTALEALDLTTSPPIIDKLNAKLPHTIDQQEFAVTREDISVLVIETLTRSN